MEVIRNRIDREGGYNVNPIHTDTPCENCGSHKKNQKGGLCVDCRKVLGLMEAPFLETPEDDTSES